MKTIATFLIFLIRFTSCLNYSADHVEVILFGQSVDDQIIVKTSEPEKILGHKLFNPLLKTVVIFPGANSNIDDLHLSTFIQNYINSKRYNVLYFESPYYLNDFSSPGLFDKVMWWFGDLYGSIISKLIASGLSVDSIELVGHSWGAGVACLTARKTIPKLPLLIGLDPANVEYFSNGSANYTIVLHTNIGEAGKMSYNASDSDLIANYGTIQEMCLDPKLQDIKKATEIINIAECSHIAALYYWGSMIENPQLFYGVECNETDCNYKNIQQLGPNLRVPGIFYFKTSTTSPYGLGLDGIKNIRPMDPKLLKSVKNWLPTWNFMMLCYYGYCNPQRKQKITNLVKAINF